MSNTKIIASPIGTPNIVEPLSEVEQIEFTANELLLDAREVAVKWEDIRLKRDALLAACDWMANSDVIMSDAWATYRQALRNLPASQSDPDNVVFPTEPS